MKYGSVEFSMVRPYDVPNGDMFGANVAERSLIAAVLRSRADVSWDLWHTGWRPLSSPSVPAHYDSSCLRDLLEADNNRLSSRSIETFADIKLDGDYIFLTNPFSFYKIHQLRARLGDHALPLCLLTHSLFGDRALEVYTWIAMNLAPYDAIVASSHAGMVTLERFFAAADRFAISQCGKDKSGQIRHATIAHIPFGVDIPSPEAVDRASARSVFQIQDDSFVLLYLGRISEQFKADLDPVLEVMQHCVTAGYPVKLILAGQLTDSRYGAYLTLRINQTGLSSSVITLFNFPDFLKTSIFAASDVFVSPADSLQETFGIAVLEAMAHGIPSIVSKWSGYNDLVVDGDTGFLINTHWLPEAIGEASLLSSLSDPLSTAHSFAQQTIIDVASLSERICILLSNRELRVRMGKAARDRASKHFAWSRIVEQYFTLWDQQLSALADNKKTIIPYSIESMQMENFFDHYPSHRISLNDIVAPVQSPSRQTDIKSLLWNISDPEERREIAEIYELTVMEPSSIADLQKRGYRLRSILLLAKKGLRRILSVQKAGVARA